MKLEKLGKDGLLHTTNTLLEYSYLYDTLAPSRKVAQFSGTFDLIHSGHICLIEQGVCEINNRMANKSEWGLYVIATINSDASITKLKGPNRPIMCAQQRAQILGAIKWIDVVYVFDDDDPTRVVDALKPDYYIKGHEYDGTSLPEIVALQHDIEVIYVDTTGHPHTSDIIERIRSI